jgi:NitT/TauT family transport system substrate-binding protein
MVLLSTLLRVDRELANRLKSISLCSMTSMMRKILLRVTLMISAGWLVFLSTGCGPKAEVNDLADDGLFPIEFQLDWVPEPQHGGLLMADIMGYFEEEGLRVTLVSGGPGANSIARVATGRAQMAQAEGNNTLLAINEGLPVVIAGALFQHDPSVFLMQQSNPVQSFDDLNGKRVRARPEWAFLRFLEVSRNIRFSLAPTDAGLELLATDPNTIQQGYYIAEPYYLQQMGVEAKWLHVWDAGYDGISAVIVNRQFAKDHPEQLLAFLRAYHRGQKEYFESDPELVHLRIQALNRNASEDFLNWSRDRIIEQNIAVGDPSRGADEGYLVLSEQRVQRQIRQLETIGALEPGKLTPAQALSVAVMEEFAAYVEEAGTTSRPQ